MSQENEVLTSDLNQLHTKQVTTVPDHLSAIAATSNKTTGKGPPCDVISDNEKSGDT